MLRFRSHGRQSLPFLLFLAALLLSLGMPMPAAAQTNQVNFKNFVVDPSTSEMDATYSGVGDAGPGDFAFAQDGFQRPGAEVCLILAGIWWAQNPTVANQVSTAVQKMINSEYFTEVSQYTGGPPITYGGVFNDTNPNAGEVPGTFDLGSIASIVRNGAENHFTPKPTFAHEPDNIYLVVTPPGATLGVAAGGLHGVGFDLNNDVYFSIACALFSSSVDTMTSEISHEVVEAIADGWVMDKQFFPAPGSDENEIADAAGGLNDTVNGVNVQAYWSDGVHACAIPYGKANLVAGGALASYFDTKFIHTFYINIDGHIEELYWNSATGLWNSRDLMAQPATKSATSALGTSALACSYDFTFGSGNLYYIGSDRILHELYYANGSWFIGGVSAAVPFFVLTQVTGGTGLSTCWDNVNNLQHVYYIGLSGAGTALVEMLWNSGDNMLTNLPGWQTQVYLTGKVGAGTQITNALDIYGVDHVFFRDPSRHIQEMAEQPSSQTVQGPNGPEIQTSLIDPVTDWTTACHAAGALPNATDDALTSAVTLPADPEATGLGYVTHLFYVDGNNHLEELWHCGTSFGRFDITQNSGDPGRPGFDGMTSYVDGNQMIHVSYTGTDNHIHEMTQSEQMVYISATWPHFPAYQDSWTAVDRTALNGVPNSMSSRLLSSSYDYVHNAGLTFYMSNDIGIMYGDIGEFWWVSPTSNGSGMPTASYESNGPLALP